MNRALIYARVSTEDQVEKFGIPVQLRVCRDWCAANGFVIVAEVTDDGVTGATLDRLGLTRLRDMVAKGEADLVIMLDVDRLSRELEHLLKLKAELERRVRVEFISGKFEDSPTGRLFFSFKGAIGQYERENTRARTMRGSRERARIGKHCGGRVAYGYRSDQGLLVPEDRSAGVVREIFNWYIEGVSVRGIARKLTERGTPAWAGERWGHASVGRILANETYAGVAYYGKNFIAPDGIQKRRPNQAERIPYSVPSLIDRAAWERVQSIMAMRGDRHGNPNIGRPSASYLLRGLLFCHCGRRMSAESSGNWKAYRCYGRDTDQHGARCRGHVRARDVDTGVWTAFERLGDPETLQGLLESRERELRAKEQPDLESITKRITRLRGKEKQAMELMCDPDLEHDRLTLKRQYLDARRERIGLERELAASQSIVSPSGNWIKETVSLLSEDIRHMDDPKDRQMFVRGLVKRAQWDGFGQIRLNCFLAGKMAQAPYRSGQFPEFQFVVNARVAA